MQWRLLSPEQQYQSFPVWALCTDRIEKWGGGSGFVA